MIDEAIAQLRYRISAAWRKPRLDMPLLGALLLLMGIGLGTLYSASDLDRAQARLRHEACCLEFDETCLVGGCPPARRPARREPQAAPQLVEAAHRTVDPPEAQRLPDGVLVLDERQARPAPGRSPNRRTDRRSAHRSRRAATSPRGRCRAAGRRRGSRHRSGRGSPGGPWIRHSGARAYCRRRSGRPARHCCARPRSPGRAARSPPGHARRGSWLTVWDNSALRG